MPEYLAPGVYIEEIERGPRPIEGVATSTAAFLGETLRGPMPPRLVTSFNDYLLTLAAALATTSTSLTRFRAFSKMAAKRAYVCRVVGDGAVAASRTVAGLNIQAIGPGAWGNRVFVKLTDSTTQPSADGRPYEFRLQVAYWVEPAPDNLYPDPFDPSQAPRVAPIIEEFDNLVWDDPSSADYYLKRLEDGSALVTVSQKDPDQLSEQPAGAFAALAGGADGLAPTVDDYKGQDIDPLLRAGLAALELDPYREVALVAAPAAPEDVVEAVIQHCEQSRFRFAVIDTAQGQSNAALLDPGADWDTSYAACYYPWIYTPDPQSGTPHLVPPSGHVAGIYARTDIDRGVWKAPANEVVLGAINLEYHVNTQTQELLNPRGVNVIKQFPGRGIRVWGARTLSTNSLWKYVSVRRLFIFLERSIYEGTQWVVFEPNEEPLWERVKNTIRLFLRAQWRNGALMGATEDKAFFIACDRSTMTQDDILNGRLICEIGVAPVRPAEFVIFRIFQRTVEAQS